MSKEKCVMCGVETQYDFNTNVNLRYGYIDGMGQLCKSCFNDDHPSDIMCIPKSLIKSTPNDIELGEKIRKLFYKQQN
jgi:hypothetical protein